MNGKKLYKSADKKVCGVCGGIAEYFGIDPTVIRLVYVLLVLFTGVGILPYIIAAIIMDDAPENDVCRKQIEENSYSAENVYESAEPVGFKPDSDDNGEIKGFNL